MNRSPSGFARALPFILLPLLALIAVLPLIAHGCSCGHDFDFHLASWLDAAAQMRHGALDPAWNISAAWNAGEPRFLFYPPLSWMLGALLTLTVPLSAATIAFTAIALLGAAITMFLLAREYASTAVALLAAAVYISNPYIMFTAFERTAYGELLAAVWIPLLVRAALRRTPAITELAVPIALLWLTNAPAAVIGTYTLALIALVRIVTVIIARRDPSHTTARILLLRFSAGGALGFALAAFYLLPAAYERRSVQVAMAIIPNMRVEDNFLFGHTGDAPHDRVLHTASLLAIGMLLATLAGWIAAFFARQPRNNSTTQPHPREPLLPLAILALCIAILLTRASLPAWHHLPELAFLQFPWRLLCILAVALALTIALALPRLKSTTKALAFTSISAFVVVGSMTAWEIRSFRQPCELSDLPSVRAHLFATHHGVEPTDEYTPAQADNDTLRWDDPPYWLANNPTAFAPGTVPNPAAIIVNYDVPPPLEQTISGVAPHHLQLRLAAPAILILNLRDYPNWQIFRNGSLVSQHLQRDDGLLAIALPAGTSTIDIRWHRTWDQLLGDLSTILALIVVAVLLLRSRTINRDA